MVYRGRISKSCLRCRKRKLRCDLRIDSCGACARAKVLCTGYRDTQELQIRDESEVTERKALIRQSKIIAYAPVVSIDERARNAFFFRYVSGFSSSYDVLEPLYKESTTGSHLIVTVDAVGLAFLSFQSNSGQISQRARSKYLDAISLLKDALVLPTSATEDSILLTVLLLDLFEKTTTCDPPSTNTWMSHVNGALALIKLRNKTRLQDYTGLRLSIRLCTNVIISCMAANIRVPLPVIKLRSEIERYIGPADPKWQMSGLTVKYADFRGAIQEGHLSSSEIISCAQSLENKFIALANSMPSAWTYKAVYLERASERIFEQYFDTYQNHLATQTWNVIRAMRIFLNDVVLTHNGMSVSVHDTDAPSVLSKVSMDVIDTMAQQICASAPQYTMQAKAGLEKTENFANEHLRCHTIIFPLYVAGLYASPESKVRPWVINELRFMADEIGIRNAKTVADILANSEPVSPWSVYAIIGSYAFAA